MHIDLTAILEARLGRRRMRFVPKVLLSALESLVRQDRLNELLDAAGEETGSGFSRRILAELGVTLRVEGLDKLPSKERFEFVSNHPLGGLDGIALVRVLGDRYGDANIRVVVNDLLMNVEPLREVFIPVNKYGSQARGAARELNEAFESGRQILMFPAGLVSRLQPDGTVRDLEWHKSCVTKALEFRRRIVPVYFGALNSMRFYKAARWRRKLGIKVNLEQALLPGELCDTQGAEFTVCFGSPVDPAAMRSLGYTVPQIIGMLKSSTYAMARQ